MNEIYYWIGLVVFWLSAITGSVVLIGYITLLLLNESGKKIKTMWIIVEYAFYRKKFKSWVKDKERHPRMKD
jgi:hypothetical protein